MSTVVQQIKHMLYTKVYADTYLSEEKLSANLPLFRSISHIQGWEAAEDSASRKEVMALLGFQHQQKW